MCSPGLSCVPAEITDCEVTEALGADTAVNVRFASSSIAQNGAEILAYGTAVKLD